LPLSKGKWGRVVPEIAILGTKGLRNGWITIFGVRSRWGAGLKGVEERIQRRVCRAADVGNDETDEHVAAANALHWLGPTQGVMVFTSGL